MTEPRTIFTVVSDTADIKGILASAADYAEAVGGYLSVLAVGVDRTQVGYYYGGASAMLVQEALTRADNDREALVKAARDALSQRGELRWAVEGAACQLAELGRLVGAHARYSDLALLPKPYGAENVEGREAALEGVLFAGAGRVVVLPEGTGFAAPRRILLAWNDSSEALAATRAALPFLVAAEKVKLVVIDPPSHGRDRSDPGGAISEMLARHKVKLEIDVLAKSLPRVTDVLLRHATDSSADMIVMGAYGHSRFREAILGGATRDMLEASDRPVYMTHG
jgi:nucleotide-binding universal stress UspA family protein